MRSGNTRDRQRGSAMLITMVIISALLAGAAVLLSMQLASNKGTDLERNGLAAEYCAEYGLTLAMPYISSNYSTWSAKNALPIPTQPLWLGDSYFNHDIDGDGIDDYAITLKNDDDATPLDPNTDHNSKVWVISTCTKYPDNPRQVSVLFLYTPKPTCYQSQEGGCNGRGNNN